MKTKSEPDIYRDTILIPELLASLLTANPLEELWLVERANRSFRNNEHWRRKVKSAAGREFLLMFMQHWLDGLHLMQSKRQTERLTMLNWPPVAI